MNALAQRTFLGLAALVLTACSSLATQPLSDPVEVRLCEPWSQHRERTREVAGRPENETTISVINYCPWGGDVTVTNSGTAEAEVDVLWQQIVDGRATLQLSGSGHARVRIRAESAETALRIRLTGDASRTTALPSIWVERPFDGHVTVVQASRPFRPLARLTAESVKTDADVTATRAPDGEIQLAR